MKRGKWKHVYPLHSCMNCEKYLAGWCVRFKDDIPADFSKKENQCKHWTEDRPWIK